MSRRREKPEDRSEEPPPAPASESAAAGFARQVAGNLRRLRHEREWSLEELSTRAGVSRAMLSQVETGKTTPTIAVLWKIATGLGVPFAELLREGAAPAITVQRAGKVAPLTSADRRFRSQPLVPPGALRGVELYRIVIEPGAESRSPAHASGTVEVVAVEKGRLRLTVGEHEELLEAGDSACFPADVAHAYAAVGDAPCTLHDLIHYTGAEPAAPAPAAAPATSKARSARRRAGS